MFFGHSSSERQLRRLARNELSPHKARQLAAHLSACNLCRQRFDRVMLGLRLLEKQTPTEPGDTELAWLTEASHGAVMKASRHPGLHRGGWTAAATVAAAGAVVLLVWHGPGSPKVQDAGFIARGNSGPVQVLHSFCVAPEDTAWAKGEGVQEMQDGDACAIGSSLAFSAGSLEPAYVTLRVDTGNGPRIDGPFRLERGTLDRSVTLDTVIKLEHGMHNVRLLAAFAPERHASLQEAQLKDGRAVSISRSFRVQGVP